MDLGGGSGAFAVHFLEANPCLQATLFDLPLTLRVATKIVRRYDVYPRIRLQAGNFLTDRIGKGDDVVLVSHIVHVLGARENRMLMKKIFNALEPKGEVLIQDFFLNNDEVSPVFPALFALNMLVHTEKGQSYSFREMASWLREAGFRKIRRLPYEFPRSIRLMRALKP